VGKSIVGRSFTGSEKYATPPKMRKAAMTNVVITGRSIKSFEIFTARFP
jgi:hypothetical protein